MKNSTKFAVVFFVVNFHLLRNLVELPYLSIYGVVSAALLTSFVFGTNRQACKLGLPAVWLLFAIMGTVVSAFLIPPSAAAYGAGRLLFVAPVFLAFVQFTDCRRDLLAHIRSMTAFFAVAALTVPLQFVFGPIGWFAIGSERGGYERYGSLVGSLTSLGIVTGCYLVLMQLLSPHTRFLQMTVAILGALGTLSKAAIANVALGLVAILWTSRQRMTRSVLSVALVAAMSAAALAYVPAVNARFVSSMESFGYDGGPGVPANYDQTVQESARDRLTTLPKQNFVSLEALNSPIVYLVGGGFGMASTALVPESASVAPMAHNQFAELITVFGLVGGGIMIWVLLTIALRLRRRSRAARDIPAIVLASYSLLLINSIFANGTVYQPASASILCLALYVVVAPSRHLFEQDESVEGRPATALQVHPSRTHGESPSAGAR